MRGTHVQNAGYQLVVNTQDSQEQAPCATGSGEGQERVGRGSEGKCRSSAVSLVSLRTRLKVSEEGGGIWYLGAPSHLNGVRRQSAGSWNLPSGNFSCNTISMFYRN
eukprot:1187930-Prorocentrum_minimum.AAC.1